MLLDVALRINRAKKQ